MTTMAIDNKDKKVLKSSIEREQNELACSAEREKIKGSKNLNVPHLRFPEFSGEWKETKLEKIAEITKAVEYRKINYLSMVLLAYCMVNFIQNTNQK